MGLVQLCIALEKAIDLGFEFDWIEKAMSSMNSVFRSPKALKRI